VAFNKVQKPPLKDKLLGAAPLAYTLHCNFSADDEEMAFPFLRQA
jgi:hypothetical protein